MEANSRTAKEAQSAVPAPAVVAKSPPSGAPMTIIPRFTERIVALIRAMRPSGVTAWQYPISSGPSTPMAAPKNNCPVPTNAIATHMSPVHCSGEAYDSPVRGPPATTGARATNAIATGWAIRAITIVRPVPHRWPSRVETVVPMTAPIPAHPMTRPRPTAPIPRSFRITAGRTVPRMDEPTNQMWVLHARGVR